MKKELLQAVLNNKVHYNNANLFDKIKDDFTSEEWADADLTAKIKGKELVLYIAIDGCDFNVSFPCGLITKSGYISTKKMPVSFDYSNEVSLTDDQLAEILPYLSDAKCTNYNPFFAQSKANQANQSALVALCNSITDPYDIG